MYSLTSATCFPALNPPLPGMNGQDARHPLGMFKGKGVSLSGTGIATTINANFSASNPVVATQRRHYPTTQALLAEYTNEAILALKEEEHEYERM
ncbi:hypothetical protein EV182_008429, partial [Spiromyces aspiralis]